METKEHSRPWLYCLAVLGIFSLLGFVVLFINIPWEWSMFMDDSLYNTWMPRVTNILPALEHEIHQYWILGRFYPVKYLANLLKWRYLPHDPTVFREFNFFVYLLTVSFATIAVFKASEKAVSSRKPLFLFFLGASFLHKPLLEIISLNPIGETWVCFFFSIGTLALFSRTISIKVVLARFFFLLVALSKEPAALVFLASSLHYAALGCLEPQRRKWNLWQAGIDLMLFLALFSLALYTMSQGSMTKGAYFHTTPWLLYAHDFVYKVLRYALWTSPFLVGFTLSWKSLKSFFQEGDSFLRAAFLFFFSFGAAYLLFMSTQGRTAYQETPAAIAFFGAYGVLVLALWQSDALIPLLKKYGALLLLFFAVSYFISVSRWHRFVRGIVEPRAAMVNLINTEDELTILIPEGEIVAHVQEMIKESGARVQVLQILPSLMPSMLRGKVVVFEFPIYMGEFSVERLAQLRQMLGGWSSQVDHQSYRIYVGKHIFENAL